MVSNAVKKEFWSSFRLVNLWLIVFPTKCALFAVIFAGPLAAFEGAPFSDAFLYLVQVLTGASIPLTKWGMPGNPKAGPQEVGGIFVSNAMGIVKQLILSLHIGLTAGPMIEGWLDWDVGMWGCCVDGKLLVGRTNGGIYKKMATMPWIDGGRMPAPCIAFAQGIFFLNVAIFCVVFSFAAGGVLAAAEGWPYWNGFIMVLGETTSSATVCAAVGTVDAVLGSVVRTVMGYGVGNGHSTLHIIVYSQ